MKIGKKESDEKISGSSTIIINIIINIIIKNEIKHYGKINIFGI